MEQYVAGLDGGGTKTAAAVLSLGGKVLDQFTAGAINYNGESAENVEANFRRIFNRLQTLYGLESCKAVCIGAAGVSNTELRAKIELQVRACGFKGRLMITGDHETALYGALGRPEGVILIAGTGSICYGRNQAGQEHRTGGFGHLIDDEGSGYAIGRDILAAVVRAHDGRLPHTVLSGMVHGQLGTETVEDIIHFVYDRNTNKRDIASLAKILPGAVGQGDPAAEAIVRHCAEELFLLAATVIERLGLREGRLAMAGSILQKDPNIRRAFLEKAEGAYPSLKCVPPAEDASIGACRMALDAARTGA